MKSNMYIILALVALTIHSVSQCMEASGKEKNSDATQKKRSENDNALLEASKTGDNSQIISLLESGSNIDTTDAYGMQPLHWSALWGHTAVVELLLDRGATGIDAPDKDGKHPLRFAAENGHTAMMITLIAHGANIPDAMLFPRTDFPATVPLHRTLAEVFAQSDFTNIPPIPFDRGREKTIILSDVFAMAAGQNKQETVETIFTRHRTNLTESNIINALIGSATAGHNAMVRMLDNEMSNDRNLRSLVPETLGRALARAVAHCRVDVIRYLIEQDSFYDTPTFSLLRPAGTLLRHILSLHTPAQIRSSERLRNYKRILTMFGERQCWQSHTLPLIGRAQAALVDREETVPYVPSPIIGIPTELWLIILNYLANRHLCDIAK